MADVNFIDLCEDIFYIVYVSKSTAEIIQKKRDGQRLSGPEIEHMVRGYVDQTLPDYQMAAFLMAVYFRGMDFDETARLTRAMLHSGETFQLENLPGAKIDKHSTGGVGDKVSLILAPLVASAGVKVPMISGRGLAHSGGTLDKLEAVPGFRTDLSLTQIYDQLAEINVTMTGQTDNIVPADKNIYALRDVTATIESVPLITASILSKKLAEDIDGLVLDVKTGRGAFMPKLGDAVKLARSLVNTAALNGLPTVAVITRMDQPLGYAVGNWLETHEAVLALQGKGPPDLMTVTLELAGHMLLLAGVAGDIKTARGLLEQKINDGSAFKRFLSLVEAQGGDVDIVKNPGRYPGMSQRVVLTAERSGYIQAVDALTLGRTVTRMGGGRQVVEDGIDYGAGVVLKAKTGTFVKKGGPLAVLHTKQTARIQSFMRDIGSCFTIGPSKPPDEYMIIKKIEDSVE